MTSKKSGHGRPNARQPGNYMRAQLGRVVKAFDSNKSCDVRPERSLDEVASNGISRVGSNPTVEEHRFVGSVPERLMGQS